MLCPLMMSNARFDDCDCVHRECAWWCSWSKCCAMVAISAELSDRLYDITQSIGDK